MITPDVSQFAVWAQHLNNWHRDWFQHTFSAILRYGFELHETNEVTIANGGVISFKKGEDCYINVSRVYEWSEFGNRPGILLINYTQEVEIKIKANTAMSTVHSAIRDLNIIE
jgi:hypothetical protein